MEARKDWLGRGWAYPITVDPATGGIATAEAETDIQQSIRIVLGTAPGERVMRPDFGCGIYELAFDVIDIAMLTRVETVVREALTRYEARIELSSVRVDPYDAANGLLLIELEYHVRSTNQLGNLVYPFYFREGASGLVEPPRAPPGGRA